MKIVGLEIEYWDWNLVEIIQLGMPRRVEFTVLGTMVNCNIT